MDIIKTITVTGSMSDYLLARRVLKQLGLAITKNNSKSIQSKKNNKLSLSRSDIQVINKGRIESKISRTVKSQTMEQAINKLKQ